MTGRRFYAAESSLTASKTGASIPSMFMMYGLAPLLPPFHEMEAYLSLNEKHLDLVSCFTRFGGARQRQSGPSHYRFAPIRVINNANWQEGVVSSISNRVKVILDLKETSLNQRSGVYLKRQLTTNEYRTCAFHRSLSALLARQTLMEHELVIRIYNLNGLYGGLLT
jgi:hypothetical protein